MGKGLRRYSNFELLKVVSISMVLLLHYFNVILGGGLTNVPPKTFNYYSMYYLESMSIIAVNCFVLVTGYFMVKKDQVKLRKALNLLMITVFYGLLFYVVNAMYQAHLGKQWINIGGLVDAIIPLNGAKWFVGSYVILFLLSPFINIILNRLSKQQFIQLLTIIIISFSIVPTILPSVSYNDRGYGVLGFVMLYCIGAYIRIHQTQVLNKWLYFTIYLLSTTITFVISLKFGVISFSWNYNTIFNVISAVCLFQFFSRLNFNSKVINYLATFTFPIYIIHTDDSLKEILYHKILKTQLFWHSKWFLLHMGLSVVFLFVACMGIELIRRQLMQLVSKLFSLKKIDKITVGQKNSAA